MTSDDDVTVLEVQCSAREREFKEWFRPIAARDGTLNY